MAAVSNNVEDVFDWLWIVIGSCETVDQYKTTSKLIRLFQTQYPEATDQKAMLINRRMIMWDQLTSDSRKQLLKG
jgi:hypothetical protein